MQWILQTKQQCFKMMKWSRCWSVVLHYYINDSSLFLLIEKPYILGLRRPISITVLFLRMVERNVVKLIAEKPNK